MLKKQEQLEGYKYEEYHWLFPCRLLIHRSYINLPTIIPQKYVTVYPKTTILHKERMKHQQNERNQLWSTLLELLENQENGSTTQSIESKAKKQETVKLGDLWLERNEGIHIATLHFCCYLLLCMFVGNRSKWYMQTKWKIQSYLSRHYIHAWTLPLHFWAERKKVFGIFRTSGEKLSSSARSLLRTLTIVLHKEYTGSRLSL